MSERMNQSIEPITAAQQDEDQQGLVLTGQYPVVPDRLYFTISEAADLCLVRPHVLRYWEKQFDVLAPVKRRGRRYFTSQDILCVRQIRELLYVKNFTIEGAKTQLSSDAEAPHAGEQYVRDLVEIAVARLETVLSTLCVSETT